MSNEFEPTPNIATGSIAFVARNLAELVLKIGKINATLSVTILCDTGLFLLTHLSLDTPGSLVWSKIHRHSLPVWTLSFAHGRKIFLPVSKLSHRRLVVTTDGNLPLCSQLFCNSCKSLQRYVLVHEPHYIFQTAHLFS
jgi:hypothetical protein